MKYVKFLMHDKDTIILNVSAVTREGFQKFVHSLENEWHETRWVPLEPCVDNILLNWLAINNYFTHLDDNFPFNLQYILTIKKLIEKIPLTFSHIFLSASFQQNVNSLKEMRL